MDQRDNGYNHCCYEDNKFECPKLRAEGRGAYTTTPRFHRCTVAVDIGAVSQPFSGELDLEGDSAVEGAGGGGGGVEARFGDGALETLIGSCET